MVIGSHIYCLSVAVLLAAQQTGDAVLERLDPPRRAAVIMALLGLTLIGLFLIAFIMVGGHWVRRLARHRPKKGSSANSGASEGALPEAQQDIPPDTKSSDTVLLDTSSKNTKIGN
jgi:hypothetical protein